MGQQKGALKLKGAHGDFVFARTKDGFIWKEKAAYDKNKFLFSPDFQKQRDNAAEFGRSGLAVKLLRQAFSDQMFYARDGRVTSRLQQVMMAITKGDTVNERGQRLPGTGPLEMLSGFEFNKDAPLQSILSKEVDAGFNRITGEAILQVPPFLPNQVLTRPQSATHYRIVLAAAELDFAAEAYKANVAESDMLPIDSVLSAPLELQATLEPNSDKPVFLAAGIRFSEVVNGFEYPDVGGIKNALSLVLVTKI